MHCIVVLCEWIIFLQKNLIQTDFSRLFLYKSSPALENEGKQYMKKSLVKFLNLQYIL